MLYKGLRKGLLANVLGFDYDGEQGILSTQRLIPTAIRGPAAEIGRRRGRRCMG